MIDEAPLLTVRRNFARPSEAQAAALRGAPTCFLADALGGRGALDAAIRPIDEQNAAFLGVAITCHTGPADNLAAFGALEALRPGDVVVAATDRFLKTAVIGDLYFGMARNRGCAAFVTDGAVRDIVGLRAVGMPCFAAGVTPNSPARNGPGTVGAAVVIGGVSVESGDIIAGDIDGVVVVPRNEIDRVIARLADVLKAEAALDAKVREGLELPEFVAKLYAAGRVKEIG